MLCVSFASASPSPKKGGRERLELDDFALSTFDEKRNLGPQIQSYLRDIDLYRS